MQRLHPHTCDQLKELWETYMCTCAGGKLGKMFVCGGGVNKCHPIEYACTDMCSSGALFESKQAVY